MQPSAVRKMPYASRHCAAIFALAAGLLSCAAPLPHAVPMTLQEQLQYDYEASRGWAGEIEAKIEITHDIEVDVALRQFAEKLSKLRPALAASPIGVLVYKNSEGKLPPSFAIPGNRIYISRELLKQFEFENELLAAIALEIGHLLGRHAVMRGAPSDVPKEPLAEPVPRSRVDFFSPAGIFAFNIAQRREATRDASRLLYEAGYDPRGLVSYLRKLQTQRVGLESGALVQLEGTARDEMSRVPPLRNPVVRTEAFLKLQGRIKKL